jgi:UDP-N-acetylglucosamine--N-acetylmuramyl-(pentapeptide) pyrophosphoryl-undecaprenol N-acetylglucosamine transferase
LATIVVAAGASGGHVYPGLATAAVLRSRGHEISFVGGDRLEARLVPKEGYRFDAIPVRRPPSVRIELLTPRGITALGSTARAFFKARRLLGRIRPDAVLGMGGFAALPVSVAAGTKRIPLVLHEQNANLSLAQRVPLRWAEVLALGLPVSEEIKARTALVGNPVRSRVVALAAMDDAARRQARTPARGRLGLDPGARTLLVLGGSLGSGPLNENVPELSIPDDVQVLHLTGAGREDAVRDAYAHAGRTARVLGYLDSIEDAYLASDVAVSRSGASAVAELALAGLPSILVPLPTLARGDQEANARTLEGAGAAVVVPQSAADFKAILAREITRLLTDAQAHETMSRAARSQARPDAAERLADVVESVIEGPVR